MEPKFPQVTAAERDVGLERLRANVSGSGRTVFIPFAIGALILGGAAFQVSNLERPWFIGAAIACGVIGVFCWLVVRGPFAQGHAQKVAQLPWDRGISFVSPDVGLVYASASTLMLETGVFRTPPRFDPVRYVEASHALELGELISEQDGSFETITLTLPQSVSREQGAKIAEQLIAWWPLRPPPAG